MDWKVLSLIVAAGVCSAAQQAPGGVKLWDRFEASVENNEAYADPYRDVQFLVTYRKPGGGEVRFQGYYDGGRTWRIRFMPDRTVRWQYDARFSDGQPGIKGSFEVTKSDLPGLISQYEPNPVWTGYNGQDTRDIRRNIRQAGTVAAGKSVETPGDGDDWLLRVRRKGR